MISFIGENDVRHSAEAELSVRHGVNGEKSLSGIIYTNDAVLNGIDRGWRLEHQNEIFVITFAVPKDYGNTIEVEFDAVHEFFYDFGHDVVYGTLTDGSHTVTAYLDFIFAGSEYMYELDAQAYAFSRDNFGNKFRLELFNDVINAAGLEFQVYGRIVRILPRVGTDLTTKVEKRFNMQEIRIEKNINNFITYKRGFGAWTDEEDKSMGRLEVEYESPLAAIFGRLHGKPVIDERYTNAENLLTLLKDDVDSSYNVSIQLSMEDLTKSGYEYEQPRAGDWLMAINDDIGIRQKVRIVSYSSKYATNGDLITHTITCNSLGAVDKLEANSAGMTARVNDLTERIETTEYDVLRVISNAENTGRVFYGNIDPETEYTLRAGDLWLDTSQEVNVFKAWNGYEWELMVDMGALERRLTDAENLADDAATKADAVTTEIDKALQGTGEISLADLIATKITGEDFETLYFQQSDSIGFTYTEDGVRKAIIAIVDGTPYIKGEHIILDGETIVDGDFKVTGDMLADGAVIKQLEVEGIDAQDVNIVNLNAGNITGGNLELSNGLKITHNGKVIFGVNADNQIDMDEDIREELKGDTGAPGADGTPGAPGTGVAGAVVTYAQTNSGTVTPTDWVAARPSIIKGQYLWTRTVTTYTDSTNSTTYSVAYSALDGQKGEPGSEGAPGADGTGISSTTVSYAQTTSGTATPSASDWVATRPAPIKGQYLWTRTVINYTDGTSSTAYSTSYSALDGQKGEPGTPGIQGPPGTDGKSQVIHVRYSANANGSSMTTTPVATTKYIGIVITETQAVPAYTAFTWSKYVGDKGAPGEQGIPGEPGADGKPTFTWVKYADTPTSGMNDFPDSKKYIGLAFNQTTATESTSYGAYQWSLMPQNIEIGGRNYFARININNIADASNVLASGSNWKGFSFPVEEGTQYTIHRTDTTNNRWRLYWVYTDEVEGSTTHTTAFSADSQESHVANTVEVPVGAKWGHLYLSNADSDGSTIPNIQIEKGNIASDWTEAPEDTQAKIDDKTDVTETEALRDQFGDYVPLEGYDEEIGEINSAMNTYLAMLEETNAAINGAYDEDGNLILDDEGNPIQAGALQAVETLLERTAGITSDLDNFTQRWNFIDTSIIMGEEGLFIGDAIENIGIRIAPPKLDALGAVLEPARIDFIDSSEEPVAFISGQLMQINRGIFVQSATIGEHKIETIGNGHTIWQWTGDE